MDGQTPPPSGLPVTDATAPAAQVRGEGPVPRAAETSFIGSAKLISSIALVSRILGMVRDMVAAGIFGLSYVWDAFALAFLVPNIVGRFVGEAALASGTVPVLIGQFEHHGKTTGERVISGLVTVVTILFTILTLLGIAATFLVPLLLPGYQTALVCELLRIMLPYLVLICLVGVLSASLYSMEHFLMPAMAPVLFNTVLVVTLLTVSGAPEEMIRVFSVAVVIAGVVQVLGLGSSLWSRGITLRPNLDLSQPGLVEIRRLIVPAALGMGLFQINELLDKVIAGMFVDEGGVSAIYFSERFVLLPLALIGVALSTAIFPTLSRDAARQDYVAFNTALARGLRVTLFLAIPAATGLLLIPDLIVRVVYERGKFDPDATARTARVLFYYAAGLVFFTLNFLFVRAYYAFRNPRTPLKILGGMILMNVVLDLVLVRTELREAGVALGSTITACANCALLILVLRRQHGVGMMRGVTMTGLRSLSIAVVSGSFLLVMKDPGIIPIDSSVVRLGLCVTGAMAITFGLGHFLCREETRAIVRRGE